MHATLTDNLQYASFLRADICDMQSNLDCAVQVNLAGQEAFREMALNRNRRNRWFEANFDLNFKGMTADARREQVIGKTTASFGLDNKCLIEDEIGLIRACGQTV